MIAQTFRRLLLLEMISVWEYTFSASLRIDVILFLYTLYAFMV